MSCEVKEKIGNRLGKKGTVGMAKGGGCISR